MSEIKYVCPISGDELKLDGDKFISNTKKIYRIKNNIPRFCKTENYTDSFGFQWDLFSRTQLDSDLKFEYSSNRFWRETNWMPKDLENLNILEAGSGAGRFTEVLLRETSCNLYSFDYSNAVEVNLKNNCKYTKRLNLCQSSIYEMPFPDNSFDKIFCFGVLQHTPSFSKSVNALLKKLKKNGEIVIDFYPSKGFITKIHSKYILRPLTKRLPKKVLLFLIKKTINSSIFLFDLLCLLKMGFLTRFLPITDIRIFPKNLDNFKRRKFAILDTFDAFSPEFDNPQKISNVVKIFKDANFEIKFAGKIKLDDSSAAVIRAVKK